MIFYSKFLGEKNSQKYFLEKMSRRNCFGDFDAQFLQFGEKISEKKSFSTLRAIPFSMWAAKLRAYRLLERRPSNGYHMLQRHRKKQNSFAPEEKNFSIYLLAWYKFVFVNCYTKEEDCAKGCVNKSWVQPFWQVARARREGLSRQSSDKFFYCNTQKC